MNGRGGAVALALTVLTLIGCAAAPPMASQSPLKTGALEAADAYSEAVRRLDGTALSKMTHPALVIREGSLERFQLGQQQFLDALKSFGWPETGSERLGTTSEPYVDGKTVMVGVPAVRKVKGMADTAFVYVVVSYDAGKTWSVLALACTDEHWLKALAPTYAGAPDILGQGNPANEKFEQTHVLDESLFLTGTHWAELGKR